MRPSRDAMADGISIRVRVRRAPSASKLQYGEPQDMVCTVVHWECRDGGSSATAGGGGGQLLLRSGGGSPLSKHGFAMEGNNNDSGAYNNNNSKDKNNALDVYSRTGPTLYFTTRTQPGHTLESCCSVQSVSSFDSIDDNDNDDNQADPAFNNSVKEATPVSDMVDRVNNRTVLLRMSYNYNNNSLSSPTKRKTFSVPCSSIKTVEKTSSLFRGYRIFFATGRASFELEFENKNGCDIMMVLLQAMLPGERFVHLSNNGNNHHHNGSTRSVDASDTASYLSTLDVEKLTERLAGQEQEETIAERIRHGVGKIVGSIEEISTSICGSMCCGTSSSVAPSETTNGTDKASLSLNHPGADKDNPLHLQQLQRQQEQNHQHTTVRNASPTKTTTTTTPVMEIDENKSMQEQEEEEDSDTFDSKDLDSLRKRRYLKEYKLPSGLSLELPPEPTSKYEYRLSSV